MRRLALALLIVFGLVAVPTTAHAATPIPTQVGLVSFTGAGLTSTGATLTFTWKPVRYATKYDIIMSTSFTGVQKKSAVTLSTKKTTVTLTKLKKNTAYFVQVRPVNKSGKWGLRSFRVGHVTIADQPKAEAQTSLTPYSLLTWNVCSTQCSNLSTREPVIDARISDLNADIVALQESDQLRHPIGNYSTPISPTLSILYKTTVFDPVSVAGHTLAGRTFFTAAAMEPGEGLTWQAIRDKSTGKYVIVFNTHLHTGRSANETQQRESEATQSLNSIAAVLGQLKRDYSGVTNWDSAAQLWLGDFNWTRTRSTDSTGARLTNGGWYDAYEQAQTLSNQHRNSGNPSWLATPTIGVTWGDHVDQVRVKPSTTVVTAWENAAEMNGSLYRTPLASDHNPILMKVRT